MKLCPTCNRTYTDDSLNFCLQDGTVLSKMSNSPQPFDAGRALSDETTLDRHVDPPPTEILYARASPTDASHAPTQTAAPSPSRPTASPYVASHAAQDSVPPRKPHRTALVVIITLLASSLLLVVAGIGAWLLLRDGSVNETSATRVSDTQRQPSMNTGAPVNSSRPSANTYVAPNTNAPTPALTPAQTPTPISSVAIRDQVIATLNGWAAATRARDINRHMSYYADTLDAYYRSTNVSASRVRADRERAYAIYTTLDVQLTNVQVVPDSTGERATATFDKTWSFTGQKTSTGSVQQKIWLAKTGGRWRITAEKELQIYYVNNQ